MSTENQPTKSEIGAADRKIWSAPKLEQIDICTTSGGMTGGGELSFPALAPS